MTLLTLRAEALRSAMESDDLPAIEAAVQRYLADFRSGSRALAEVAQARDLFTSGVAALTLRKARLAEELTRRTAVFAGYRPPRSTNTWHLDV